MKFKSLLEYYQNMINELKMHISSIKMQNTSLGHDPNSQASFSKIPEENHLQ